MKSLVGQHIGQYRVLDRIGQGGMGSIYRAADDLLDREVALKVLDVDHEGSSARFRAEAVSLARLSHPGIAAVYELLEHDSRQIIVMELVRGQSLHTIVEQMGVFSPQRAAEICMQVLDALAHAHSATIVHRDLKPSNLMMTETGAIKIMDFGIARLDGSVHLTHTGVMMGTPAYMAPEQVQGHPTDARVDLYAMGVVFYRLISGELPFQGETPFAMAQSHVNNEPTPIELVRPDLPTWVGRLITRALAKAPEQRFQSAMEFRDALASGLAELPPSAAVGVDGPTDVMARPESPFVRRGRRPEWTSLAAAAVVIGGMAWFGPPSGVAPASADSGRTGAPDGAPGAVATPASVTTRTPPPAGARPAPVKKVSPSPTASALFPDVKLLTVIGTRTNVLNVSLAFSAGQMKALPLSADDPLAVVPYRGITNATYVYAKDPEWHPQAGAPAEKLNIPGILGRRQRWLVVQTRQTYAILRLDGENWSEILKTFEGRTGVTIARPVTTDK